MIISKNNDIKKGFISLEGKIIPHSPNVKILGTIINDTLDWSDHLINSSNSLIKQPKCQLSAIKTVSKYVDKKYLLQYSNAILISKINYHIEIWGKCSKTAYTAINNIILKAAHILSPIRYGKTNEAILKSIKWMNLQQRVHPICLTSVMVMLILI